MHAASYAISERPVRIASTSSKALWLGRLVSALPLTFLIFDTASKLVMMPFAVQATKELGFTETAAFTVGIIEAACLVLYMLPRTSILGAVLWTGYLGGAIATHVRAGSPLFTHMLFPIYVAVLLWAGLWLRGGRLRRVVAIAFDPVD
jgi:DoxX-like protein